MTSPHGIAPVQVVTLGLVVLFAAAVIHKYRVLRLGAALAEPVIQVSRWTRQHATGYLCLAGALEFAIALLLLARPVFGLVSTIVLLVCYSWQLRRLPPGTSCQCFGHLFSSSGRTAIIRNLAIAGVSVVALGFVHSGASTGRFPSQASLGLLVMYAGLVSGVAVSQRGSAGQIKGSPQTGGQ